MSSSVKDGLIGLLIFAAVAVFWTLPIILGVRLARRKGRSPHLMWVGIHPFFGWIAFVVLAVLQPLKECPQCREKAKASANICPHCRTRFEAAPEQSGGPPPLPGAAQP